MLLCAFMVKSCQLRGLVRCVVDESLVWSFVFAIQAKRLQNAEILLNGSWEASKGYATYVGTLWETYLDYITWHMTCLSPARTPEIAQKREVVEVESLDLVYRPQTSHNQPTVSP